MGDSCMKIDKSKTYTINLTEEKDKIREEQIIFANWIDCQRIFGLKMGRKNAYRLEKALIASDIIPQGRTHDGLADSYNTALLFAMLEQNPDYELNWMYRNAREEEAEHLNFTMGDLFSGIVLT